jgi:hypothetical protein
MAGMMVPTASKILCKEVLHFICANSVKPHVNKTNGLMSGNIKANLLNHLVLFNFLEMLHSELTPHLATSGMELHLVEKRHLTAVVPAEERH